MTHFVGTVVRPTPSFIRNQEEPMPRRPIPNTPIPRRPDRRRQRGNGIDAQRQPSRRRRGEVETIAERGVIGARTAEGRRLVPRARATARRRPAHCARGHRGRTGRAARDDHRRGERAARLVAAALRRDDRGTLAEDRKGNPPAVSPAVRVSERRARLLGLDAPR